MNVDIWPWIDRLINAGIFLTPIIYQLHRQHRQNREQLQALVKTTAKLGKRFRQHEREDHKFQRLVQRRLLATAPFDTMATPKANPGS